MRKYLNGLGAFILALAFLISCQITDPSEAFIDEGAKISVLTERGITTSRLSGAIFTTTEDGSIVNENVRYESKEDVYLDGGPGPNAPAKAAGLPEGDYYFQVTDPSGKDLLSTDHISARKVHINMEGVIDLVYSGTNFYYKNGQDSGWVSVDTKHNEGIDMDHSELGAITVQLFPYDDTPNPGGVYKVWLTPVDKYAPLVEFDPFGPKNQMVNNEYYEAGNFHGFLPAWSKTDNYKVLQKGQTVEPPEISVRKFHDRNLNGVQDLGEEDITGWLITFQSPVDNGLLYTPSTLLAAEAGKYFFTEDTPSGIIQTAGYLDGVLVSAFPSANPLISVEISADYSKKSDQEFHSILYGNVGLGSIMATKVYDKNANGIADEGEPGIPGWRFELSGITVQGEIIEPIILTSGADGSVTAGSLLPGTYSIKELIPSSGGWVATGNVEQNVTIESTLSGSELAGSSYTAVFTNYQISTTDFGTKGYWHNKNGLGEILADYVNYVNTLAPYSSPSSYFEAGDEPFDGFYDADGDGLLDDMVAASYNNDKVLDGIAAGEGTALAEISLFLTDPNAGGDNREQLAQQLLAFLFNTQYRLGGSGYIEMPDGTFVFSGDLIFQAITAWENGTDIEQNNIKNLLDWFNNQDVLTFIPDSPSSVIYP